MKLQRSFYLSHSPVDFYFSQNARDFVVEELPLYPFTGEGEHLILKVRKKGLSTWDMLEILSAHLGIKVRDIGYAGLKDKEALTYQYISLHRSYEAKVDAFVHEQIKVLEKTYHKNKVRLGHLKGNRFFIRLKRVYGMQKSVLDEAFKRIAEEGAPNFFGYQRFGKDRDNHVQGKEILEGKRKVRRPKLKTFLVNAYQSHLFNAWLSKRIELSHLLKSFSPKEAFKALDMQDIEMSYENQKAECIGETPLALLKGDVLCHYPHGKLFISDDNREEIERFRTHHVVPTGLLSGKKTRKAESLAGMLEAPFDVIDAIDGDRRYAWIFPEIEKTVYKDEDKWYEVTFTLPKGAYATNIIEEVARRPLLD